MHSNPRHVHHHFSGNDANKNNNEAVLYNTININDDDEDGDDDDDDVDDDDFNNYNNKFILNDKTVTFNLLNQSELILHHDLCSAKSLICKVAPKLNIPSTRREAIIFSSKNFELQ